MTTHDIAGLCEKLRASATAFREHTVYDSEGDPLRLIVQADEAAKAADTIERQAAEVERLQRLLNGRDDFIVGEGLWPKFCDGLPARAALTGEDA